MTSSFQELLTYIQSTDLEYILIEKGGRKLSLRRDPAAICSQAAEASQQAGADALDADAQILSIRSPIVGRFYRSMGPDRPPLVVDGGRVTVGQKVAIVEAMKIKKDVFSSVAGRIARIPVQDGDPVEYGQELFGIIPDTPPAGA